jgi:hypothetical protein
MDLRHGWGHHEGFGRFQSIGHQGRGPGIDCHRFRDKIRNTVFVRVLADLLPSASPFQPGRGAFCQSPSRAGLLPSPIENPF